MIGDRTTGPAVDDLIKVHQTPYFIFNSLAHRVRGRGACDKYAPLVNVIAALKDVYKRQVTHWMPLPDPPEGEE